MFRGSLAAYEPLAQWRVGRVVGWLSVGTTVHASLSKPPNPPSFVRVGLCQGPRVARVSCQNIHRMPKPRSEVVSSHER